MIHTQAKAWALLPSLLFITGQSLPLNMNQIFSVDSSSQDSSSAATLPGAKGTDEHEGFLPGTDDTGACL